MKVGVVDRGVQVVGEGIIPGVNVIHCLLFFSVVLLVSSGGGGAWLVHLDLEDVVMMRVD
jgi:hypothetical protein